ncbi:hypothetical protein F4X86_01880 [Candidatus Saccharibacteria bacterium]|nr:hypothetical protein [Candidatus Saccharibacteria bacterium]
MAPQHAGAWICFKAVDRDDNTVYSFAQLIQHPDSEADRRDNQNGSPDNNGGNGSQPDTNAHGTEAAQPAEAPSGGSADQDAAPGGDQPEAVSAAEQGIDPEGSPAGEDQSTADGAEEPATAASATGASLSEGSESGLPGWLVIVAGLAATAAVVLISVTVLSMRKK